MASHKCVCVGVRACVRVCVRACVCVIERGEREREGGREGERKGREGDLFIRETEREREVGGREDICP